MIAGNWALNAPGFTIGFTLTHGFSVTISWTVGNSYSCPGNPGDQVCIWYKVAHTACRSQTYLYSVSKMLIDNIGTIRPPDPFSFGTAGFMKQTIVAAPNRQNQGGGVICGYNNECRSRGDKYWDCYGRKDKEFRYCPPPGHPLKLHLDPGPLPQDLESAAIKTAREAKKKRIIAERGKDSWADYERKEMELEKRLKMEYAVKWRRAIQQEKAERQVIEQEEKEAKEEMEDREEYEEEKKKKKKKKKNKKKNKEKDTKDDIMEVGGGISF